MKYKVDYLGSIIVFGLIYDLAKWLAVVLGSILLSTLTVTVLFGIALFKSRDNDT